MSDFQKFHRKHKGFSMIGVTKNPNISFGGDDLIMKKTKVKNIKI